MIEVAVNGWVLNIPSEGKFVYTDDQVNNYFINNHLDEVEEYVILKAFKFAGCIEKNIVGFESETFFFKEPDKFTLLFMLGHKTNFK